MSSDDKQNDWSQDPSLSGIDFARLQALQQMASQSRGKSQAEMMPFLLSLMQGNQGGAQFSASEADLIISAIKAGLYLGNPTKDMLSNLDIYSENLGLAYQIADDILDEIGDPKELGKAIGSDKKQHKNTYTSLNGLEAAFARLEHLTDDALEAIAPYYDNAEFFRDLALQLKTRRN